MNERKQRLEAIFHAAMDLDSSVERDHYLAQACAGDFELRREVDDLLSAAEVADAVFQAGQDACRGDDPLPAVALTEKPGDHIGRYKLLEKLGEGGFGVVYMAAQTEPVKRRVALKIIKVGMDTREVVARFEAERQALALMEHPNIAKVLEAGATETGRPFFVMELVRGIRITEYCDQNQLGLADRLKLFLQVCHAVQHAHQKGIIHRDLKPSNILVTLHDGVPVPKVIDFGIAKATQQELTEKTVFTRFHQFIGTPAYMSPEQAELSGLDIDTRSDIYSLGVLLYELLVGQPPFDGQELLKAGLDEMRRVIRETEPEKPSTRLTQNLATVGQVGRVTPCAPASGENVGVGGAHGVTRPAPKSEEKIRASSRRLLQAKELIHQLRGDLDWIVMKALEKDRTRRYETANGFAMDIQRHLNNEPVSARPPSRLYRLQKLVRRNKLAFAAVAAVATVLLLGVVVSTWQAFRATRAERTALTAQQKESELRQQAQAQELKARQIAYASDMNRAQQAVQADEFDRALELLDRHRPESKSEIRNLKSEIQDLRGWEWRYLWRQCQGEERFILGEHTNGATAVGLLADGKTVFSAGGDKSVRLWDLESRRQIGLLPHPEQVIGAAASQDGRWLATATRKEAEGQPVLLWDLATQKIAATLTTNFWLRPRSITFSPDSKWLAFATVFGGVRLWDVKARSEVTNLPATTAASAGPLGVAFSRDSRTLAYNENEDGAILLWDTASRSVIGRLTGHQSFVEVLAFSPDGQTLASGSDDRTARLWNLADRRERFEFTNHSGGFTRLAFSPDGRTLAMTGAGGAGRVIRLVEVETGSQKAELRGHLGDISCLAFTPDGQTLLSASDDGTLRVWNSEPRAKEKSAHVFTRNSISLAWSSYGPSLCLSPDGRHLLTVYTNQTFSVWDTLRLAEGERHPLPFTNTTIAAVAPGGRLAAFASRRGEVVFWDVETGQARFFAQIGTNQIRRLVFSLDGRYLAAADEFKKPSETAGNNHDPRRTVRVWDVATRKETHVFSTDGEFLWSLTFSTDAKALIAGTWRGSVKIWQLDGPAKAATFPGHSGLVRGLASRPDGQTLVSAGPDDVRFWDVRTRRETDRLNPKTGWLSGMALSPDGRQLANGASNGRITIWDVTSRQEVATLDGHQEEVTQLAFTPDGDHLVSASKDQLRVWRAPSFAEADAPMKPNQ